MSQAARPNAPEGPLGRPEPWTSTLLRVLVHAITAAVIAWPLTTPPAVAAATLGAATGSLLARFVARSPLRVFTIVALGVAGLLGVLAVRFLVVDLSTIPASLGPANALLAGDALVFGGGGLVVSTVLRALSARRPALTILEAGLAAGGFATLLVAHRHGAIHRPYEIADPLIARGDDPTAAILIIGAVGAATIALLLLSERSLLRSAFHLGVLAVLLLVILYTTAMNGTPNPPSASSGALGLQDDDSEQREGQGQGGGANGRRSSDDLDFLDEYPSGGSSPDAVVIFHDDYSPPSGYYYFRQNAFSQFNGRKLVGATLSGVDTDVDNVFPTTRAREVPWTPAANNDRTTVETTVALLADNSAPMGLEAPERFVPATNPAPNRFRRLYRVNSVSITSDPLVLLDREVGDPAWSEETRRHYAGGPTDPRYAELAQRVVQELPDDLRELPVARALAITQYLGRHGTYSLRSRHAGAEDPTGDFLFGDLTGYCVHFAHAAVFLMRAAGVPARVGTGYAVAEANRQGGSALLLRNSDQHAWPEIYVEGAGWVVMDVAPENVLDPPGDPPDPQLQRLLGEMARGSSAIDDLPPPRPITELAQETGRWIGIVLGLLLGLLLVIGYGWKLGGWLGLHVGSSPARIYRAALYRLSAGGVRRRWGESPEAFARRVRVELPALSPLTNQHLAAAFGHARPDLSTMRADFARLTRELRASVPWWRRLLGAINPYSWVLLAR